MTELIDWLTDQDFRQWQSITARLADRTRERERAMGAPDVGSFHSDRARLIDSVGREAQRVVDTYDKEREAAVIAHVRQVNDALGGPLDGDAVARLYERIMDEARRIQRIEAERDAEKKQLEQDVTNNEYEG